MSKDNLFLSLDQEKVRERCREFANHIVSKASWNLIDEDRTILDIPLQCVLFAECFYNDLKNFIDNDALSEVEVEFDILTLFKKFIDNKFDIMFSEKELKEVKNDQGQEEYERRKKCYIKSAMRVSICYMLRGKKVVHLLDQPLDNQRFLENVINVKALGLIAYFSEEALNADGIQACFGLIHRTFAEYLVAKYLFDALCESGNKVFGSGDDATYQIVLYIALFRSEYQGISRFFIRMLQKIMPDLRKGCPFGSANRKEVLRKWTMLSHERFNTYLADKIITEDSGILNILLHSDMILITWLMLCLKECTTRELTQSSENSPLENFFGKTFDIFKEKLIWFEKEECGFMLCKYIQPDGTHYFVATEPDNAIWSDCRIRNILIVLIFWFVHYDPPEIVTVAAKLKRRLVDAIEQIRLALSLKKKFIANIYLFGTVSVSVVRQPGFSLENDQLKNILQTIFKIDKENCLASQAILEYSAWGGESLQSSSIRDGIRNGKYLFENDRRNDWFKGMLEIGSPEFQSDNNTTLLELQINWFLSLPALSILGLEPYNRRDLMNPFLVVCVDYFLVMINRYVHDEIEANDYRRRVLRQALRLDARILRWLQRIRLFKKESDLEDEEEIAVTRAIEVLPLAHQVAHKGDTSFINQLGTEEIFPYFFKWTKESESINAGSSDAEEVHGTVETFSFDGLSIDSKTQNVAPPALYLAAANGQTEFIDNFYAEFINDTNEQEFKSFISQCMRYALWRVNDEYLVLTLLDVAKTKITKKEFWEIVPFVKGYAKNLEQEYLEDGEYMESLILFTFAKHSWLESLTKYLEVYDDDIESRTKCILNVIHNIYISDVGVGLCDVNVYVYNFLITQALKIASETGMIHQKFYTTAGHSICCHLIEVLHVDYLYKEWTSKDSQALEYETHLRTILSNIWEKLGENRFVKFICGSKNYAFDGNAKIIKSVDHLNKVLLKQIVQEFIPHKLTLDGINVLSDMVTANDDDGENWMIAFFSPWRVSQSKDAKNIFEKVAIHLLRTPSGVGRFEDILSSFTYCRTGFVIVYLFDVSDFAELADYVRNAMGDKWTKRADILRHYREEVLRLDEGPYDQFEMKEFLTKCKETFAPVREQIARGRHFDSSLDKLENMFSDNIPNPGNGNFFCSWIDVAINVLKFLYSQVQLMLKNRGRETVLDACWASKRLTARDRFRLMTALTFTKELVEKALDEFNGSTEDLLERWASLSNAPDFQSPIHKFIVSLDCLTRANNFWFDLPAEFLVKHSNEVSSVSMTDGKNVNSAFIINNLVKERKFGEALEHFITYMSEKSHGDFFDFHTELRTNSNNEFCHGLVKFLINVAIENRWIV